MPASSSPVQAGRGSVGSPHALGGCPTLPPRGYSVTTPNSFPGSTLQPRKTTRLAVQPAVNGSAGPDLRQHSSGIPMASLLFPAPQSGAAKPAASVTSKEWVIPPRPKPGRKPATDTPPTKRKAQNRAAQRAFRERRAARVGELEEQLEEQAEEHRREQQKLKDRIHELELETQTLKTRCQVLENMLERERFERRKWSDDISRNSLSSSRNGSVTLTSPQNPTPQASGAFAGSPGVRPQIPSGNHPPAEGQGGTSRSSLPAPRNTGHSFSISQIISPPEDASLADQPALSCGSCAPSGPCACAEEVLASTVLGCGKCSLGTKCECLEATLDATLGNQELKRGYRSSSPSVAPEEKRLRSDTAMETDFTALFSSKKQEPAASAARPYLPLPVQQSIPPRDSCGFCTEGTYCVCADTLAPVLSTAPVPSMSIPPISTARQIQTPPPSETDVVPPPLEVTATGAIKLPSLQSMKYGNRPAMATAERDMKPASTCGPGGPGTCAQCLADPKSGLFCRSLAANLEKIGQGTKASGCCGRGGPGGCCKKPPEKNARTIGPDRNQSNGLGLSLSCADAYMTLSSHRHFNKATDEIGTWLPLLKAAPRPAAEQSARNIAPPRPAMEVEAASIMSVLKGFDVRFGN